jgi:hypothetical protein
VHGQEQQAEIDLNKAWISQAKGGKEDYVESEQAVAAQLAKVQKAQDAKDKQKAQQLAKKNASKPSGSGSSGTI